MPQWSPPLNGGSRAGAQQYNIYMTTPQWSPPFNGGSTVGIGLGGHGVVLVVMEPAGERREYVAAT